MSEYGNRKSDSPDGASLMVYGTKLNLKTGKKGRSYLKFNSGIKISLTPEERKEFEIWIKTKQWESFLVARTT
jgi:hypothetical protein